jgi:hypothetical protein
MRKLLVIVIDYYLQLESIYANTKNNAALTNAITVPALGLHLTVSFSENRL